MEQIRNPNSQIRNPKRLVRCLSGLVAVISTVCYHFSQLTTTERERSDRFQCEFAPRSLEIGRCAPVL